MALSYHQEEMHTMSQKANVRSCGHHIVDCYNKTLDMYFGECVNYKLILIMMKLRHNTQRVIVFGALCDLLNWPLVYSL